MVTTQTMGDSKGLIHIVQGGPANLNWRDFCEVRKLKVATVPGQFITSAGETAGDPMDLLADGDQDTGNVELVIERVGAIPQDIDTSIATSGYALAMRPTGGHFKVACWKADESTSLLKGQKLGPEATGHLRTWAYNDTNESTDTHVFLVELAEDQADIASTDPVIFVWY